MISGSGDAVAKKAKKLKPTSVTGVHWVSKKKTIRVDHKVWSVAQPDESNLTLTARKKKKKGEDIRVGLTCMCKANECAMSSSCSISKNGNNASCRGSCSADDESCAWQTIAGGPIGAGSPGQVEPL